MTDNNWCPYFGVE